MGEQRQDKYEPPGAMAAGLGVARGGTIRSPRELLQPREAPKPPPVEKPSPAPRKRSRSRVISALSGALTLAVFLSVAGAGIWVFAQRMLQEPGPLAADKIVYIPKGSSIDEIGQLLEREGVIRQPGLFEAVVQMRRLLQTIPGVRAGEYQFKAVASLDSVVETLGKGQVIQHSVTVPEGLTSEQIVTRLGDYEFLTGTVAAPFPKEGELMPTTHRFERGTHRQQVVERLRKDQKALIEQIWKNRSKDLPLRSPEDMVILASIVEKETGRADERTRVAGVFINRLNRKMKLQSDPTIVYGLVGGKGTLGRGLTRAEIDQATPYNTYVIPGLPPGAIANPGRASLEAVANPSRTRDIFFVADGTGGHAFAETLEQHNRNVARWRQIESGQGGAQPVPPAPPALQRPGQRSDIVPPAFAAPAQADAASVPALPAGVFAYTVPQLNLDSVREKLGAPGERDEEMVASDGQIESWPVPAGRMSAMRAAASVNGAPAAPADPEDSVPLRRRQPVQAVPGRRPGFDAAAGTSRDPLLNRGFDLSTGKTVPQLR